MDNREAMNSSGLQNAEGTSALSFSSRILAMTPIRKAGRGSLVGSQASA